VNDDGGNSSCFLTNKISVLLGVSKTYIEKKPRSTSTQLRSMPLNFFQGLSVYSRSKRSEYCIHCAS